MVCIPHSRPIVWNRDLKVGLLYDMETSESMVWRPHSRVLRPHSRPMVWYGDLTVGLLYAVEDSGWGESFGLLGPKQ